mmetsp:Transcript_21798/g.27373  ORF Transcript_21798/g.27373 Transcript_21798/m.27373 type:complete len:320 (+) Transcript_21798:99-1058(+)
MFSSNSKKQSDGLEFSEQNLNGCREENLNLGKRFDRKVEEKVSRRKSPRLMDHCMDDNRSSIKIRVQIPRSKMPYRWREPLQPIQSCLVKKTQAPMSPMSPTNVQASNVSILKRALSQYDEVDQDSWLTSSFIDLIFSKFARTYRDAHFMPVEFAAFRLKAAETLVDLMHITDILGNIIEYQKKTSVIFFANIQNMHWNLIRIEHFPFPEVQLFEPLGKPVKRGGGAGVSSRVLPQYIIHWLDTCWPLDSKESWVEHTYSAVTKQHQITGFDCGVACLLYAEKCGIGQARQDIDEYTTQKDITNFRQILMQCFAGFPFK